MDNDDRELYDHRPQSLYWRRQWRTEHGYAIVAVPLLPLLLPVARGNRKFLFYAEQFRWESTMIEYGYWHMWIWLVSQMYMFCITHLLLEQLHLFWCHCVRLGDDWNNVDLVAKPLHEFHIKRLQAMPRRCNEIQTCVHTAVNQQFALHPWLICQILFVLGLDEIDYGHPTIAVVNGIAETRCINDSQLQIDAILFQQNFGRFHGHRLFDALRWSRILFLVVDVGQKHRIDQRRFAQTALTHHHQCEFESSLHRFAIDLIRQIGKANVAIQFFWLWPHNRLLLLFVEPLRCNFIRILVIVCVILLQFVIIVIIRIFQVQIIHAGYRVVQRWCRCIRMIIVRYDWVLVVGSRCGAVAVCLFR